MNAFTSFLARLLIFLFTAVFIYPAILLAFLVLGFTASWKSGVVMLISALLLLFVLKREAAALPAVPRGRMRPFGRKRPAVRALSRFPGEYDREASPPQLSDIYFDLAARMKEDEELLHMLKAMDGSPEAGGERRRAPVANPGAGAGAGPNVTLRARHAAGCTCAGCSPAPQERIH
ncbi:hypothetical protein I8J29_26035 [Paenibacillus sp. MWE-103]|uniref:Uncharacterized protein n=1 Tax=Paenibacillus artemisiicola TaxID=1172618 RepID=A0ABS3WH81_9BACL|nr:hypothetical protein [Paenibacillus artemisiicola]MBO7747652.1 hypothetical protein [Paenibacillus artemisiicola]